MSWMKRPQSGAASRPEHPGYAAAATQPYGNQQNMFPNYQGVPPQQQQQMWQMPQQQQQYNQQYGQVYQQQPFVNNTSQYFQQPQQYNQNYANQNYDNAQQGLQQNYYQNQTPQVQNYTQSEGNTDGWEDNWNWGWEDTTKQQQKPASEVALNQTPVQPQHFNNANVLEESFTSTNTWNWSVEDKKQKDLQLSNDVQYDGDQQTQGTHLDSENNDHITGTGTSDQRRVSNGSTHEVTKELDNVNDINKDKLPNISLGKRFNLENLTPQWSIESQMSQDSSDLQTHSEETYKSENQSRNSSKDSPGPHTDTPNFNFSHSGLHETGVMNSEWSKQSTDDSLTVSVSNSNRRQSCDELANSVQELTITNRETADQGSSHPSQSVENLVGPEPNQFVLQQTSMPPPPPVSSLHNPQASQTTTPSTNTAPFPLPSLTSAPSLASSQQILPPPSALPVPPLTSFPTSTGQNPFKSSNPFSHKNIAKVASTNPQLFPPQVPGAGLASPAAVNKVVQQERLTTSYGVNLETTPDNSERPDQPQHSSYRQLPVNCQIPENLEVAPQNDRNEYLQTAHLSIADYGENTDFSGNIAPPGLRRMGVGQQDQEYNQNLNTSGDEPPPGLARMVPGQQTESDNTYNQRGDDYMDRQIDGRPTDTGGRPYRQAEGQQTSDTFAQPATSRNPERRPVGLDRMVPGEPSNDDFPQYQAGGFNGPNDHRVVTGVDHDYTAEVGPTDIREQNVDGSDYTEPAPRIPQRSVVGSRVEDAGDTGTPDYGVSGDDRRREITMEGENLQDLSLVSSTEISFSRDHTYDGIELGTADDGKERTHDGADITQNKNSRQSHGRVTSGEDSDRERGSRRDREKTKSSRDRYREKERGRYSRSDRKYDREPERRSSKDERRADKDRRDRDRRTREDSPDGRRYRRSTRSHRYETEDTDCYSDKERERRKYREGSYTSTRPPRGEERSGGRPGTTERDREREGRYEDDRGRRGEGRDRRYRPIDMRKAESLRRDRPRDDRKKVVTFSPEVKSDPEETYSSGSRGGSREATDEEPTRRRDDRRPTRQKHYYDGYVLGGAGWDARRQYSYFEHLRRTDPAAYMHVYNQLMDPRHSHALYKQTYYDGYGAGYGQERGSVHSGRSSEAGLKHADTYDGRGRDAASLRTDLSDRDLTTDMSLNLQLEESTVRSERMTPLKFSTAHVKCSVGARSLAVSRGRDPRVQLLPLTALTRDPLRDHMDGYPGPLVRGVTHKKSVVEYCERRAREAGAGAGEGAAVGDSTGAVLLWDLLALLLRQNGVVVGSDVAELLMKNTRAFEYKAPTSENTDCGSSLGEDGEGPAATEDVPALVPEEQKKPAVSEKEALAKFREYLIYGNRQEALEWAMQCGLWAHALQLSWAGDRRARAAVSARFVAALGASDPLHSLYAALAGRAPPALACVADERWGDWRPHAAILLSNSSTRPDQDRRNLTQLGDTLNGRGLIYSAQFCYLSAGVPFGVHPLAPLTARSPGSGAAPPRLSLLLADPRATSLRHFATDRAIFATEIYEYALSLSQERVLDELVVYKLVLATRLTDAGEAERALRYAEQAARALTASPQRDNTRALAHAVATLADRLKFFDPALHDEPEGGGEAAGESAAGTLVGVGGSGSEEPSPRHQQWLTDVTALASRLTMESSQNSTPQHGAELTPRDHEHTQYSWNDQTLQQPDMMTQQYPDPVPEAPDYAAQYYRQQQQQFQEMEQQQQQQYEPPPYGEYDENPAPYGDSYWQNDTHYGYNDGETARPTITMPGATRSPAPDHDREPPSHMLSQTERDSESPTPASKDGKTADGGSGGREGKGADKKGAGGGGWLSGVLSKLALRPPNQMILPDDKNPTIVWDEDNKCWRDTASGDSGEASGPPPPPPTGPPVPAAGPPGPLTSPALVSSTPLASPSANMLRMQKGRHIKKSYVDVLNPGGAPAAPVATLAPPPPPAPGAPPSFFIPAPLPHQESELVPNGH
ncbi:uncharacterized protein LOC116775225 isoform X2 [Danaus plexippus]|uniref:uncharacterized protein LOC116775225 isoform X2 n=1 Tax=Danaus plexippus TaxID=13037 RepID=UPI002AAFDDA3|nr:uncharacterized protein LOC116775225 isoform X2 [Danaus plexippus]